MPAKSKAQQRFFGMVRAAQKGEMENPSSEVLDAADSISVKDAKKMAKTKHKGLPEVKEEKKGRHPRDQKELDRAQAYIKKNPNFGKKDVKEGSSIIQGRKSSKKSSYRGATGDHRRDKEGNIEADFYKKKPAPTGEKWGDKSGRPKKPSPLEVRARRKKRKEEKAAKAAGSVVQTKSGKKVNSKYEELKAKIYARDDARKKKNQEYAKKHNPPKVNEELTGDMKTDLEKYRVPRGPGGNPIRMGDKVRSMKGDQPLGQLKVKYGADKVREYYKKNRPVDEGVSAKYKGKYYKLLPSKVREKMNGKGGLDGDYRKETGKVKDWVTDRLGITNTKRDGVKEEVKDLKEYSPNVTYQAKGGKKSGKLGKSSVYSLRDKDESKKDFRKSHVKDIKDGLLKKEELQVDEGRENAVIAKRILQNKTKCADCGSYAHVTGASNCPAKKDPEGLPEGVMDIVRRYGKKKPEKKPQKAQDAGARLRRKVERRVHAKYVSGSEDNVPDELRDHKTWSEFKKYLAI